MNLAESMAETVTDLAAGGEQAHDAVPRALGLAIVAWQVCAPTDPAGRWDVFGLDVCATAEILHLGLVPTVEDSGPVVDGRALRREAARLVEALALHLEAQASRPGQPVEGQLDLHAAAAQLRRGGGALR